MVFVNKANCNKAFDSGDDVASPISHSQKLLQNVVVLFLVKFSVFTK